MMIMIVHCCDIDFDVGHNSRDNLIIWQMLMLPMMKTSGGNLADGYLDVDVAYDNADGADDKNQSWHFCC